MGRSTYVTLSRVLLAVAVALLAGGLIYDATRDGTEPNLSMLYFVAVAVGLIAMWLGLRARGTGRG